jgi:immunity protein Imm1 of predicted polymorphic toxin system
MIIFFHNFQDHLDSNNGRAISSDDELISLLEQMRAASPVITEFCGPNDFQIDIGIGGKFGSVQYSRIDGAPPYLMAVSHRPAVKRGYIEFLCGGTPTPIAARYIISFDELKEVVLHFLSSGERSETVSWQVLNPRACKEDAELPLDQ